MSSSNRLLRDGVPGDLIKGCDALITALVRAAREVNHDINQPSLLPSLDSSDTSSSATTLITSSSLPPSGHTSSAPDTMTMSHIGQALQGLKTVRASLRLLGITAGDALDPGHDSEAIPGSHTSNQTIAPSTGRPSVGVPASVLPHSNSRKRRMPLGSLDPNTGAEDVQQDADDDEWRDTSVKAKRRKPASRAQSQSRSQTTIVERSKAQQSGESRRSTREEWEILVEMNLVFTTFSNTFCWAMEQMKSFEQILQHEDACEDVFGAWKVCEVEIRRLELDLAPHRMTLNKLTHEYKAFFINLPYAHYSHAVSPSFSKLLKAWEKVSPDLERLDRYAVDLGKMESDVKQLELFIGKAQEYGVLGRGCKGLGALMMSEFGWEARPKWIRKQVQLQADV